MLGPLRFDGTDDLVQGFLAEELLSLGDLPATGVDELHKLLTQLPVGIPATVVLLRGERRLERMVVPAEYPRQ